MYIVTKRIIEEGYAVPQEERGDPPPEAIVKAVAALFNGPNKGRPLSITFEWDEPDAAMFHAYFSDRAYLDQIRASTKKSI